MRLATPVRDDRVSPVFDTARQLLLLDLSDSTEQCRRLVEVSQTSCQRERARYLADLGVDVLICGAISRPLAGFVSAAGIVLFPWVAGPVDEVVQAYLAGRLTEPRWRMPGRGNGARSAEGRQ